MKNEIIISEERKSRKRHRRRNNLYGEMKMKHSHRENRNISHLLVKKKWWAEEENDLTWWRRRNHKSWLQSIEIRKMKHLRRLSPKIRKATKKMASKKKMKSGYIEAAKYDSTSNERHINHHHMKSASISAHDKLTSAIMNSEKHRNEKARHREKIREIEGFLKSPPSRKSKIHRKSEIKIDINRNAAKINGLLTEEKIIRRK